MKLKSVGIVGVGAYVPEKIMTNFDFEKIIETSDEWIRTRTGIEERHFATKDQTVADLCVEAGKKALENANIKPEEIDLIIVSTCTSDYLFPSVSCLTQKKLGLVNAAAFDLNAACTGFVYSLTVANSLIKSGVYKKIMVVGGEILTRITDMTDRNTCILFGDGAAAAIVAEVEEGYGILSSYLGADGDLNGSLESGRLNEGNQYLHMKGQEVFKFAVNALPNATEKALADANLTSENVDLVIPHQANMRIVDAASKKLGISIDKFVVNMSKYGNTSSASIGIAMDEALKNGRIKKGDIIVLTGFGGGLTFGSLVMKWAK